jgi:hypothetical protein
MPQTGEVRAHTWLRLGNRRHQLAHGSLAAFQLLGHRQSDHDLGPVAAVVA